MMSWCLRDLPSGLASDLSVDNDVIELARISLLTTAASPYGTDCRTPNP